MIDLLQPILKDSPTIRYSSGATIIHQGEVPRGVCVVKTGIVKAFNITAEGEEQIITFNISGEIFPTPWIFSKAPAALYFYAATEDTEIYMLNKTDFLQFMKNDLTRSNHLLEYYTTLFSASLIRINALEQFKAIQKIVFTLYYLTQRFGTKAGNDIHINLKLTQQEIASMTGLTRETVSVQLNILKRQKVISLADRKYIVDFKALISLMGEENLEQVSLQ